MQEELIEILDANYVPICRLETGTFELNTKNKKKLASLFSEIGMKLDD